MSVLVVDDVERNLLALESVLDGLGYNVILARSGEEALKAVLDRDFAVILLDVVMPILDGFETASLIRQRERSRLTPIIFLTAVDTVPEHVLKGYSVGAVDYIHKPISPEVLRSKVKIFAELHEKSERLLELEQREHERALAHVQAQRNRFFSLSLDMMAIAGFDGRFQEVNPAWEQCLGVRAVDLQGTAIVELVHPEEKDEVRRLWDRLCEEGDKASFEARCRRRDGSYRWLSWNAMAFSRERCCYAVARDITELKSTLDQLSRHASDLAIINADLEQFAYIAAHDLREPLRTVASCVSLLDRRYSGKLGPDADQMIRFSVEGATRMHELIGDLLTYARLSREEKGNDPVDCGRIVEMVLLNLSKVVQETGARLHVGPLPTVRANASQLQTLFQNLIENALKYRGQQAPIIEIGARRENGDWAFWVKDNGIGIDPSHHERIFRIFQRLHDRESQSGSGIGLAVVKKVVERHGGRVWVTSKPGLGTTFFFTLPLARDLAPSPSAPHPAAVEAPPSGLGMGGPCRAPTSDET